MQRILFVCTGNTCRSPMAEYLFNYMAQGLPIQASSAGLFAVAGAPMSPGALHALARAGIDGSPHRAQPLTPALLNQAQRVYCMTQAQLHTLQSQFHCAHAACLAENDISDPYGEPDSLYETILLQMAGAIGARLEEICAP